MYVVVLMPECTRCKKCFRDNYTLHRHHSRKKECEILPVLPVVQNNTILVLGDKDRTLIDHRNIVKFLMDVHDTVPGDSLYVVMGEVLLTFGEYIGFLNESLHVIRNKQNIGSQKV